VHYLVQAVPLLVVAAIVALIVASRLRVRGAFHRPVRAPRPPRPRKSTLHVSRDQMDKDLNDLIKRR
jgi:hypothetical protein